MDIKEYEKMKQVENVHWWFVARREIVMHMYRTFCLDKREKQKICDVGCGMGVMLKALSQYGEVSGIDMEEYAVSYCRKLVGQNGEKYIKKGVLPESNPFETGDFSTVLALDVLEHIEDDSEAVKSIWAMLEPDGKVLITVPAFKGLWGYNDEFVHHKRRYTTKQLRDLLQSSGFDVLKISYYNFWLSPVIWIVRKIKNLLQIKKDDLGEKVTDNFINRVLYKIFKSEAAYLEKREFPFGVSIICVARRKEK